MTHPYEFRFMLQIIRMSKDVSYPLEAEEVEKFIQSIPNRSFKALLMAQNELLSELCVKNGSEILDRLRRKYETIMKSYNADDNQCQNGTTKPNMFERL